MLHPTPSNSWQVGLLTLSLASPAQGHLSQLSCPTPAGFDHSRSIGAIRLQGLPTSTMLNGKDAPNWLAEGVNAFVDLILLGKRQSERLAGSQSCH